MATATPRDAMQKWTAMEAKLEKIKKETEAFDAKRPLTEDKRE